MAAQIMEFKDNLHRLFNGRLLTPASSNGQELHGYVTNRVKFYDLDGKTLSHINIANPTLRSAFISKLTTMQDSTTLYDYEDFIAASFLYVDDNDAMIKTATSGTESLAWTMENENLASNGIAGIFTSAYTSYATQYIKRIYLGLREIKNHTNINAVGDGYFKPLCYYDVEKSIAAGETITSTIKFGLK